MQIVRATGTAVLFLLFGTMVPAYAQHDQQNEKRGKTEKKQGRKPLIATANNEGNGVVSPDGRWIAYISDESGRFEVYVRGFPKSSGKWQVSTEGAREPLWSRGGRELFFRTLEGNLKVIAVTLDPVFSAGKPRLVYSGPFRMGGRTSYDITAEGDRFLIVTDPEAAPIKQLHVVLNWLTEIKAQVRTKN